MSLKIAKGFSIAALASIGIAGSVAAAECIAPANPGGGWDFTCRTISKIMYDIGEVDQPIQVTNMAGGGGGLAYSHVVTKRNDDEELIVAASSATATRLAQDAYGGLTADQVRFLGAIGVDPGAIAVAADSPFMTLNELLDAVIAEPSSITFAGGSAVGGFDHLKVLMALNRAGLSDIRTVKYIGVDGGADAITQTIGGHTQAMTGDISEVVGFMKAGEIRVLAVMTEERVPGFEEIPTAKEQGIDIVAGNWRGLYVPKGISEEAYMKWSNALQAVADSDAWAEAMAARGLAPFNKVGDDFQDYVNMVVGEIEQLSREIGVIQ
ncbi:MAG: tripartite tricarboxylate transporter substrate-binding protein [Albidovulum sp.]|nr:tripartite tricarboxylate transporter substrate-binding protein [Albidovulum sp.]